MTRRGKKYKNTADKIDRLKRYGFEEAVQLTLDCAFTKFDETLDVAVRLGVDPRHADQMVRGTVVLPHGVGKVVRVIVFAKGEKEKEAREAGADHVGSDEYIAKIQEGWMDFDKAIATPDMMSSVGKLGRILGPRGMMPNPRVGTVTADVAEAIKSAKGGAVEFRVEKAGVIQAGIGKASFTQDQIEENLRAFVGAVMKAKPEGAKGTYLKRVAVSSTMGPGVRLDLSSLLEA